MAAPLRYALILLCWGMMLIIYLPLLPAAGLLLRPAFSLAHWQQLLTDSQLIQALTATIVSTLLSVGGALVLALLLIATLWPSASWQRLSSRLPWLLGPRRPSIVPGLLREGIGLPIVGLLRGRPARRKSDGQTRRDRADCD